MDIVLGVSMTPMAVRIVLVEGGKADGVTVDHDVFEVDVNEGAATTAERVVAAILGTQECAAAAGHHVKSIGVACSGQAEAAALDAALAAWGAEGVTIVSDAQAAGSLAQAVGRAVGYDTTALLFLERGAATLSVVRSDDGSIVKVLNRSLYFADVMAVLAEMAAAVDARDHPPGGVFVVGSGVDLGEVKARLEGLMSVPVNAPEEAELALARGAALASASAPVFEASTAGLAYSQDPDQHPGPTPADPVSLGLDAAPTESAPVEEPPEEARKPFLLVGSALTSIFVIGVVALAISMAVSIRPTVDQRPSPIESAIAPSSEHVEPALPAAQPVPPPPAASPAQTIKAPVPVVQQAPQAPQTPRTVFVERPAPPPPQAPEPAPAPVAAPAPAPPVYTPPVVLPPPMVVLPQPQWPSFFNPPVLRENVAPPQSADPSQTVDPSQTPDPPESEDSAPSAGTSEDENPAGDAAAHQDSGGSQTPGVTSEPTVPRVAPTTVASQPTTASQPTLPGSSTSSESPAGSSSGAGSSSAAGSSSSSGSGDSGGSSSGGSGSPLLPFPFGGGDD